MREMRKKDRKMADEQAMALLISGEYGILSTCGEDKQPYGVPLSYVVFESCIYFHCAAVGTKLDNIISNNKVSFTVVGKTKILPDKFTTEYASAIAIGKAYFVLDEEKEQPLMKFIEKYSKDFIEQGKEYINKAKQKTTLVKIKIESITGKQRA